MQEICVKKLVPCEYCELEVPLDILSEHSAACGSRTEQCSKCNKHVMLKDLEKHPRYCSRKEPEAVPCEHCGLQTDWNELMEHAAICGTRTERCFLCTELVMVKDRDTHFVTCGKGLNFNESISCDYCGGSFNNSSIGKHIELCRSRAEKCNECNNYIERKDMEFHLMMCKQKRLSRLEFPCQYCGELYSSVFLRDHSDKCGTRTQKCEKCDKYIALKNMETHSNVCEEKRQFRPEFPCRYCGESYLSDFLEDHVDKCGTRTRKCEKCDKYIALKNMETHSNVCRESMSKTHGDCPICHQSIPWMEMNIHCAYCTQVNSEIQEYEHQNKINELALRKGNTKVKRHLLVSLDLVSPASSESSSIKVTVKL
ncbi:hypothetical protein AVEN_77957-2 [Araneus ventricosus]|uniref:TRAFD1/XAF1 zinc finger domain-containing protein n=1 Tax=Araneus ventricosus TaxID=182803 RepID=A0A4Y2DWR7_ARAVE|nr:hypothetical protein AVEN_77957-2 [Araneus ventricosus]